MIEDATKKLSIIPLGGLGEIGKNMTVVKYGTQMVVVDAGLIFPDDEMLGIDIVIPDMTYLIENKTQIKAILLTHGHEDHIGALPFLLKEVTAPVYGSKLTIGLVQKKIKENGPSNFNKLNTVNPRDIIKIGPFTIEFVRICHSIPGAYSIAITSPVGTVFFTGDFKFDQTPVDGEVADYFKLAEFGEKGVLAMFGDSTNAERAGSTGSASTVGNTLDKVFQDAEERIIVASFASNVHRLQQIVDTAVKYGRRVAVAGRSMVNMLAVATELGYLVIPEGILVELEASNRIASNKLVIITTGSQGEPLSALTRMAMSDHRQIDIIPGDTVVISASPIPGNEKSVARTIDNLYKQGAKVIDENIDGGGIHVSGHASQEDLKLMLNLIRPKYFIPVHGEYRMLVKHSELAVEVGVEKENIFILSNGQGLDFSRNKVSLGAKVVAGRVMVDGLGVGDVGNIVMRDRKLLSSDGILIVVITLNKETGVVVAGPDIVSRGFVYVRESETLMDEAKLKVRKALDKSNNRKNMEWSNIKSEVRDVLGKYLYEKTRRRPMILPIIMEV
ncbi:MAG: ribonuclease J [Clostridia bacterium]